MGHVEKPVPGRVFVLQEVKQMENGWSKWEKYVVDKLDQLCSDTASLKDGLSKIETGLSVLKDWRETHENEFKNLCERVMSLESRVTLRNGVELGAQRRLKWWQVAIAAIVGTVTVGTFILTVLTKLGAVK